MVTLIKLTKRKESGVEVPTAIKEPSTKTAKKRGVEVPIANVLILKDIGYPFRIRGDPRPMGLEIDNYELFTDYAKEQWMGTVVRQGVYLFDRYIMPDYAFQVVEVEPEEAIISKRTKIHIQMQPVTKNIPNSRTVTLDEVVGHEQVKQKCKIVLEYLQNPSKYGEWAPRAVLFHGPPGTGKTMTAQAVANEAKAKIFFAKASDLIGVHVGDGGRRISALFEDARKQAPSIIFIDELDAIGLARSFQSIRGDVSEVVTALLGELDQTNEESGVVVIGATNALPLIDPAIKNRFDTVFEFQIPTLEERYAILQLYIERLPLTFEMDPREIAKSTEGLSGRDLRNRVLKEALHLAITEGSDTITAENVRKILDKIKTKSQPNYTI
ncbi:AAA family ATPase [Candidatus Thorarchaeota archaeon]|nr:MAG: AAA family ATPase [Candidatus Thorarchaeota archaeon]